MRLTQVPEILPYKYTKLMYNAAISPLASAAGIDNGQLVFLPLARRLFFALIQENYGILTGAGLPLGKVGPFHPDTVQGILAGRSCRGRLPGRFIRRCGKAIARWRTTCRRGGQRSTTTTGISSTWPASGPAR